MADLGGHSNADIALGGQVRMWQAGNRMSDQASNDNEFAESLPPQCPPGDATSPKESRLIRLWKSETPTLDAFASHAARGLPIRGDASACQHASCSMFEHDPDGEQLNAMRALPHFRNFTHAFVVKVNASCGMAYYGAKKHVDLWMFKSFDPVGAVEEVVSM